MKLKELSVSENVKVWNQSDAVTFLPLSLFLSLSLSLSLSLTDVRHTSLWNSVAFSTPVSLPLRLRLPLRSLDSSRQCAMRDSGPPGEDYSSMKRENTFTGGTNL